MLEIVGVKFRGNGKLYYFDPNNIDGLLPGDKVIAETQRGLEYGIVSLAPMAIEDDEVKFPLKNIVRKATEEDDIKYQENLARKKDALNKCKELTDKCNLNMKLVDVEFAIDNSKIIFYFTSDGRVDFRELVRELASVFKTRIELRQIGVRDESKILGDVGSCGRGLCCAKWINEFQPVSIKMAKNQNLSLNPSKISGICGRLMCCLKYENDAYTYLRKGMPQVGEKVKTKDGFGKVVDTVLLEEIVKVRLFTGEKDEDGREKLSPEIYEFKKDKVKRLGIKKKKDDFEGVPDRSTDDRVEEKKENHKACKGCCREKPCNKKENKFHE